MTSVTSPFLNLEVYWLSGGSYSVWVVDFSSTGREHAINSFYLNSVAVDHVGRCTCNGYIILCIIPIHGLSDCTLISGGNSLDTLMAPLHYAVATWYMRASQSELDSPFIQETFELFTVESGIIICEYLLWQPSFIEH